MIIQTWSKSLIWRRQIVESAWIIIFWYHHKSLPWLLDSFQMPTCIFIISISKSILWGFRYLHSYTLKWTCIPKLCSSCHPYSVTLYEKWVLQQGMGPSVWASSMASQRSLEPFHKARVSRRQCPILFQCPGWRAWFPLQPFAIPTLDLRDLFKGLSLQLSP